MALEEGYTTPAYTAPKTYAPPKAAPKVVVAEIEDDYNTLAEKYGADPLVMAEENDGAPVQAGAAYTLPPSKPLYSETEPPINPFAGVTGGATASDYPVPRYDPETDGPYDEWLEGLGTTTSETGWLEGQWDRFWLGYNNWPGLRSLVTAGGGEPGRLPGQTIDDATQPIRDFFNPTSYAPGVGLGAGATLGMDSMLMGALDAGGAGGDSPVDIEDRSVDRAVTDRIKDAYVNTGVGTGYPNDMPPPGTDAWFDWLDANNPYAPGTPDYFNWMNTQYQYGADPLSNEASGNLSPEEQARQDWYEIYMNPENKGRGGGIVGWIEERTGLDIDPEEFFTGEKSDEVLQAILDNFRDDELAYLNSHGILVIDEDEGYDLPDYGGGYTYPTPAYYPAYPSYGYGGQQYQKSAELGLVSWSI